MPWLKIKKAQNDKTIRLARLRKLSLRMVKAVWAMLKYVFAFFMFSLLVGAVLTPYSDIHRQI